MALKLQEKEYSAHELSGMATHCIGLLTKGLLDSHQQKLAAWVLNERIKQLENNKGNAK